MKSLPAIPVALLSAFLAIPSALAQAPASDDPLAAPSKNRFGLSYRVAFNAPVNFKNISPVPAPTIARLTPDGSLYNYDDGYVLTDSSCNALGFTRYWGYDSAGQASAGSTITMERSVSVQSASTTGSHYDPLSGFELTYDRELIRKESWRGGLDGAFGYTFTSIQDDTAQQATVTRVDDVYSFPASAINVLPPAPYTGRFSSPGPVVVATPVGSATTLAQDASFVGHRDFRADVYGFRIGPYLEVPVSKSINLTLSGGFALVYVSSDFDFNEVVTQGGASSVYYGSGPHSDWLPGGYVAGGISVALSDKWSVVGGVQFQDVGRYTHAENGMEAKMDLSKTIFATLGVTYSF